MRYAIYQANTAGGIDIVNEGFTTGNRYQTRVTDTIGDVSTGMLGQAILDPSTFWYNTPHAFGTMMFIIAQHIFVRYNEQKHKR